MVDLIIDNERLDMDAATLVTFKKSQQLNGVQDLYSYSNTFNIENSSKNRRLLKINYLPNSKAKSMTQGYSCDVVFSGCIFLKGQTLKVQKESASNIPIYLIFTDSFLVATAKRTTMNQVTADIAYTKNLANFTAKNAPTNTSYRTGPISAQDVSGVVAVEEVPILLNARDLLLKCFTYMGYSFTGDILTDAHLDEYYTNQTVGVYGTDGVPVFAETYSVYDYIVSFLKTFNGFIEVSDSARAVGVFLWKNIETIKNQFVDYSSKFVDFQEYAFEGGLAKINNMSYASSPAFYNGFFNNNKSIVESTDYLKSDFGAGPLKLFADQEITQQFDLLIPTDVVPLRTIGETTEPKILNLFRFEEETSSVRVFVAGEAQQIDLYKPFSPNILEIYDNFHKAYTDNIALPTFAQLTFRYDAVFLSEFKMHQVFFIKQLATYWLPLELNFSTKKDAVKVKCLMIEKTPADVPEVFDFSMSVDYYGATVINDISLLYSALNTSPAQTMIITAADLTKNNIYVNGVQVLAFPTAFDVSAVFEFKAENIETPNKKSNSDVLFRFVSQAGGVSRLAKINVAHNGRANYISEFKSELNTTYTFNSTGTGGATRSTNYSAKITTPINIFETLPPSIGDTANNGSQDAAFKILEFDKARKVSARLSIGDLNLQCVNSFGTYSSIRVHFRIRKNGAVLLTLYTAQAIYTGGAPVSVDFLNKVVLGTFFVSPGDDIAIEGLVERTTAGLGVTTSEAQFKNIHWKFTVTEQL